VPGGGRGCGQGGRGRGGRGRRFVRPHAGLIEMAMGERPSRLLPISEENLRDTARGMANIPSTELDQLKVEAQTLEDQLETMRSRIATVEPQRKHTVVRVDDGLCTRCGICASICPNEAIVIDETVVIDPARCSGCGACADQCPRNAVHLVQERRPT